MNNINDKNIKRLTEYKNSLIRMKSMGMVRIFSDNLADTLGIKASQVRKDFSIFKIKGIRRGGYNIDDLINSINLILGKEEQYRAVVIGVGNLGISLINYEGFEKENIKITAGFDINPGKFIPKKDIPIMHIDNLLSYLKSNKIEIAILCVPAEKAKNITAMLENTSIKGIINFAPVLLIQSDQISIKNVDILSIFEQLIFDIYSK